MDDGGAGLVVLLLRDPHLLEGGERGKDGAADPNRVFALRWRNDLDLHRRRRERSDLLLHAIGDSRVHRGAAGENGVSVEILTDIDIALHDAVVRGLMDASRLHTQEGRLEESLRATETLVSDGDNLTVGQLVALLQ